METEKHIIFGDGAQQLKTYNKLKSGLELYGCFVKTGKHTINQVIKCVGENASFVCIKTTPHAKILDKEVSCSCVIKWKNGKTKTLCGTVPMMLFDIYANQGKTK